MVMSEDVWTALAVGFVLGIIVDGLLFDWPFRKRGKR